MQDKPEIINIIAGDGVVVTDTCVVTLSPDFYDKIEKVINSAFEAATVLKVTGARDLGFDLEHYTAELNNAVNAMSKTLKDLSNPSEEFATAEDMDKIIKTTARTQQWYHICDQVAKLLEGRKIYNLTPREQSIAKMLEDSGFLLKAINPIDDVGLYNPENIRPA